MFYNHIPQQLELNVSEIEVPQKNIKDLLVINQETYRRPYLVVFIPGFGASAKTFHFNKRYSLMNYLLNEGFSTYLFNYNEHKNDILKKYLFEDIINALKNLPKKKFKGVFIVAHSMGGMLSLAGNFLKERGHLEDFPEIQGLITLGTAKIGGNQPKWLKAFKGVKLLSKNFTGILPTNKLLKSFGGLVDKIGPKVLQNFLYDQNNFEKDILSKLSQEVLIPVPFDLINKFISHFADAKAVETFSFERHLKKIKIPVVTIAGKNDKIAAPHLTEVLFHELGSALKGFRIFGKQPGDSANYGHIDLLLGHHAPDEVYPFVHYWLEKFIDSISFASKQK